MHFDVLVVLPILVVAAYGLLVLVLTPWFRSSAGFLGGTALMGLAVAAASIWRLRGYEGTTAGGLVRMDGFALFFDGIFVAAGGDAIPSRNPLPDLEDATPSA